MIEVKGNNPSGNKKNPLLWKKKKPLGERGKIINAFGENDTWPYRKEGRDAFQRPETFIFVIILIVKRLTRISTDFNYQSYRQEEILIKLITSMQNQVQSCKLVQFEKSINKEFEKKKLLGNNPSGNKKNLIMGKKPFRGEREKQILLGERPLNKKDVM